MSNHPPSSQGTEDTEFQPPSVFSEDDSLSLSVNFRIDDWGCRDKVTLWIVWEEDQQFYIFASIFKDNKLQRYFDAFKDFLIQNGLVEPSVVLDFHTPYSDLYGDDLACELDNGETIYVSTN